MKKKKNINKLLAERRIQVLKIAKENGATRVRIFGSVAKKKRNPDGADMFNEIFDCDYD